MTTRNRAAKPAAPAAPEKPADDPELEKPADEPELENTEKPADELEPANPEDVEPEPPEAALSRLTRAQLLELSSLIAVELSVRPVDPAGDFL